MRWRRSEDLLPGGNVGRVGNGGEFEGVPPTIQSHEQSVWRGSPRIRRVFCANPAEESVPLRRAQELDRILFDAAAGREVTMSSSINGKLVTETLSYDGGRHVTAYLPPTPPGAIVFAGDGQLISQWGGALEAAKLPPTMIVGTHRLEDETLRLHEYSPAFDAKLFAAHEKFFVEDARLWARSRFGVALPAERTAVFGVSASGEFALAMGLRHPDLYGAVFCASPGGGYLPPAVMPKPLPRAYLVAGSQEPFFLKNATRWAVALRDAGAAVVMVERAGSHGTHFWREEFPLMVEWAFGRIHQIEGHR